MPTSWGDIYYLFIINYHINKRDLGFEKKVNNHISSTSFTNSVETNSADRWTNNLCLRRPSELQTKKTELGKQQ